MKRIILYYSLSGNTERAVKAIAQRLDCDTLKIDTVKPMPKAFAARILVGGGQVMMNVVPKLQPIDVDFNAYDEVFLGTPVWNGKGVPAINALLKDEQLCRKVTGLIITSGSGNIDKCVKALLGRLPNVKHRVSLLDSKQKDCRLNAGKIDEFVRLYKSDISHRTNRRCETCFADSSE